MIAHLKGNLIHKSSDSLVLDVNGVGYEVFVPSLTLEKLSSETTPISLLIHTVVREDALSLFGFLTQREKQLFTRLISVSGIGPRLALNILSKIPPEDLIHAIHREDLVRLTTIQGVGKKTAERILVELKDKLLDLVEASGADKSQRPKTPLHADVLSALLNLGYNRMQIEKTMERIKFDHTTPFEQALKEALRSLSKT